MHMQLRFKRSLYEDHSYFAEKSYDAHIRIWCVSINPDGVRRSTFGAGIGPNQFEELARLMVEVDPRAAIRAFGAGMRDVEIEKREVNSSKTVAAKRTLALAHAAAAAGEPPSPCPRYHHRATLPLRGPARSCLYIPS